MSGWVIPGSLSDEIKNKVREAFNQSRLAVYRDKDRQNAFLRAAAGVWVAVQSARSDQRYHPSWPKLEPGQRFDSHETNAAKLLASGLSGAWFAIFQRFPSGKENSVFFNVVNTLLSALEAEPLGEAALKSMLPKKS